MAGSPLDVTLDPDDSVDLHMHTTYSDGHWAPEQLFDYLAAHSFRLVAVTDHDQIAHIPVMQALGAARGISVVPATEMTTDWNGRMAHVLCFGFDPALGALDAIARTIKNDQLTNTLAVYDELVGQGYTFPNQAEILAASAGQLTHPVHLATLLTKAGHAANFRAAVTLMQGAGYHSMSAPLAAVIDAAHADGGVALIAHPGRQEEGFTLYDPPLLDAVRQAGLPLDGIEVYYPTYRAEQVQEYAQYVREHGWLSTSGSDSHGPNQRLPIAYPAQQIAPLLERLGVHIRS